MTKKEGKKQNTVFATLRKKRPRALLGFVLGTERK